MNLTVELDREVDGRWIADIPEIAGVTVYGNTREEAVAKVQALALRVIAEEIEHGERKADSVNIQIAVPG